LRRQKAAKIHSTTYLGVAQTSQLGKGNLQVLHYSVHGSHHHLQPVDLGMVAEGIGTGMHSPLVPFATTLPAAGEVGSVHDGCCSHGRRRRRGCCAQSLPPPNNAFSAYEMASKAFHGHDYCSCWRDPQSCQMRSCMNPSGMSHVSLSPRS
jgi:hypothetical protein